MQVLGGTLEGLAERKERKEELEQATRLQPFVQNKILKMVFRYWPVNLLFLAYPMHVLLELLKLKWALQRKNQPLLKNFKQVNLPNPPLASQQRCDVEVLSLENWAPKCIQGGQSSTSPVVERDPRKVLQIQKVAKVDIVVSIEKRATQRVKQGRLRPAVIPLLWLRQTRCTGAIPSAQVEEGDLEDKSTRPPTTWAKEMAPYTLFKVYSLFSKGVFDSRFRFGGIRNMMGLGLGLVMR